MYSNTDNGPIEVFLVDDHKCILWGLEKLVTGEHPRMRVAGKASSRADALLGIIQTAPNVVVLDLDLGSDNSLEFLPELLQKTSARILILTGARDQSMLDRAVTLLEYDAVAHEGPRRVVVTPQELGLLCVAAPGRRPLTSARWRATGRRQRQLEALRLLRLG